MSVKTLGELPADVAVDGLDALVRQEPIVVVDQALRAGKWLSLRVVTAGLYEGHWHKAGDSAPTAEVRPDILLGTGCEGKEAPAVPVSFAERTIDVAGLGDVIIRRVVVAAEPPPVIMSLGEFISSAN